MGPEHSEVKIRARLRSPSSVGWATVLTLALGAAIAAQSSEDFVVAWNSAGRTDRPVCVMVVPDAEVGHLLNATRLAQLKFEPDFSRDVVSQVMPTGVNEQA